MDNNKKEVLKSLGFKQEMQNIELGLCAFCQKSIKENDFRDKISRREYSISGLCQTCIDKIFDTNH